MCIVCITAEEQTSTMAIIVALAVSLVVVIVEAELTPTKDQEKKLVEYHNKCLVETSADAEMLAKLLDGVFPEEQKFKEYLLCISKKAGFQNDDGEVQKDVVIEKLGESLKDPSKAKELTESCITQGSPTDIVYKVVTCTLPH
ncbi:hypothetical protein NQ314_014906 [Rhamnusium bicolor]|uniref:Uncharacterized protein n=1 Tax=Rhamnusium bicolor TaxID=1586634 RepID=A0AAV8WZR7_9CUCU|nr:hypothetical protein NQ314_014906 [Rhamnusium bicolor]